MSDGLEPSFSELVALRSLIRRPARSRVGRLGNAGPALSNRRGRGMEYAESREYVIGDEVRHIDWRLTARSGRVHTKLFQEEKERAIWIVADTDPRLFFGTRIRFKSVQAARAGAIAAWVGFRAGDRIGALRGTTIESPIPPIAGIRGVMRVLQALVRWYSHVPENDAGLAVALDHVRKLLRPGSHVVILSEASNALAIAPSLWSSLAMHNEVTVILLTDPFELDPPRAILPLQMAGSRMEWPLDRAASRQRWRVAFAEPVIQALRTLPRYGLRVRNLSTEDSSESWLIPRSSDAAIAALDRT